VSPIHRIQKALDLRPGEGRLFVVMGAFLLVNTATTTVLSAAKNGLFLSVYEPELIPRSIIYASLLTAVVALLFTGVVAETQRRSLAMGLTAVLALSVLACRLLVDVNPEWTFVVYLWLSAVQVLVLTHAWDYASSMLTGRQAKRILPFIGVGASVGAILGGTAVNRVAPWLGTENLLWIALALVVLALPLVWLVEEPTREIEDREGQNSMFAFVSSSGRGLQAVGGSKLLRIMAVGLIALTITGTLIDLQLKFLMQETLEKDRITAIYALLSAGVGAGTLILQLWASRVLFPRLGVSVAAMVHGGTLVIAAGGPIIFGGLAILLIAQALDDILQFSLQKPVEQVSLLPFPDRVKSVAMATLGGVLRPLSKAAAGGIALGVGGHPRLLQMATVASAAAAVAAYSRHRLHYMSALEGALARHAVDLGTPKNTPLVVDKDALTVIDRGLTDPDPGIVIFSASLLEQLPATDALPRLTRLFQHAAPPVRAEAARILGRIDAPLDFATGVSMARLLSEETVPLVLANLLESVGRVGGVEPSLVVPYLDHGEGEVRRAALGALTRLEGPGARERVRALLQGERAIDRIVGAQVVGDLGLEAFIDDVASVVEDAEARPAALEALSRLGPVAVPTLASVVRRRELPLPLRRTVVSALATIDGRQAEETLLSFVTEPSLGPAALHSLTRKRSAKSLAPVDEGDLRAALREEIRRGLVCSAIGDLIESEAERPRDRFVASELHTLREQAVRRVLEILALSYDPNRIASVSAALLSDSPSRRSNALELMEGTLGGPTATVVMPFLDLVAEGMPLTRVLEQLTTGPALRKAPALTLLDEDDWWARALGLHYLERDEEISTPVEAPEQPRETHDMIPLIERVMILKGSEFFRNFPSPDLAGIAAMATVVHVDANDVIFQQGDEGEVFYIVVSGAVVISRGKTRLATLGPREGFGEMAILDRESRSATATAEVATTLLALDRDSFDRAIEQNPVVARGVYRVLTERLRNTLAQVAAG
jgi:HEAT repeat protein/uncharacterized membrane protein